MLRDSSVFSQAINDVIEERIGNQEDTIDLRYLTNGALQNGGESGFQPVSDFAMNEQTPGTDGILDSTANIAHLDSVHVGTEEDIALGSGGTMDQILPLDGSPLGNSFDYASIHEEANLNQELLKEKSAHLEQVDELEL